MIIRNIFQILPFYVLMHSIIQGAPLATEHGIYLIIFPVIRILQRLQTHSTDTHYIHALQTRTTYTHYRHALQTRTTDTLYRHTLQTHTTDTLYRHTHHRHTYYRHIPLHFSHNKPTPVQTSLQSSLVLELLKKCWVR